MLTIGEMRGSHKSLIGGGANDKRTDKEVESDLKGAGRDSMYIENGVLKVLRFLNFAKQLFITL